MTVNIGDLAATTLRKRKNAFADNATNNIPLLRRLKNKGKVRKISGGRKITCPLFTTGNDTFQRYHGFEQLNINDGQVVDAAEFDPVQAVVHYTISGREASMNRGKEAAVRLVDGRMKAAMAEINNNIGQDLLSDGTSSNQIGGLQHLVADDPTASSTVGGIDQSANAFWRNQVTDFSADLSITNTVAAGTLTGEELRKGLNDLWIKCTRGNDAPDLVVMDELYYALFESSLQALQRYASADSADLGFPTIKYKGADVLFEKSAESMPNRVYMLNTDYLEFTCYKDRAIEAVIPDGIRPINQDGLVFPIVFMGNLVTDYRAAHGVLIP